MIEERRRRRPTFLLNCKAKEEEEEKEDEFQETKFIRITDIRMRNRKYFQTIRSRYVI